MLCCLRPSKTLDSPRIEPTRRYVPPRELSFEFSAAHDTVRTSNRDLPPTQAQHDADLSIAMALANGDAKQVVSRRTSAFLTLSERDQKKFLNDLPNHARNPLAAQALMVKEIATLYASLPKGTRELLLLHLCDLPVTVSKRQVHSNENVHNAHLQTGKQTVVTSDIPAAITLLSKHIRSMGPSEESLLIRAATKAQMLPELNEIYRRFTPEGRNELIKALAENPTFSPVHEEINAPFYL